MVNVSPEGNAIIKCLNVFSVNMQQVYFEIQFRPNDVWGDFILFMQQVFPLHKSFGPSFLPHVQQQTLPECCWVFLSLFLLLLVKHHPVSRSIGVRKADHGCVNSSTFCSNEGDHNASVTFWTPPHTHARRLPSRHTTNPPVLTHKLWRTSWSGWTFAGQVAGPNSGAAAEKLTGCE